MNTVEIACDESGSEGENLIGGETDVFAHAGVRVDVAAAAECVREIRARIGSPAVEYKANHLLRAKHRPVLVWLLGPSGPLLGNAHVELVDKTYFVVSRMIDVLAETGEPAMADLLHREGPRTFGHAAWMRFLAAFTDLMRASNRRGVETPDFFALLDELCRAGPSRIREILEPMRESRQAAETARARKPIPVLDPLLPALVRTIRYWSPAGPVSVVHDEQPSLTADRIAWLAETLDGSWHSLRFVDSRVDPRVQIADFLAGTARRIASEEIGGRGDPELTTLLRPYVTAVQRSGSGRSGD